MIGRKLFIFAGLVRLLNGQARDLGDVAPGADVVRVAGFGDFGYRGEGSGLVQVAQAVEKLHRQKPFTLGLTFGDNFYLNGVKSVNDPLWKDIWETEYGPMKIPFYASLGNHDYYGKPKAEVDYTGVSPSATWKMPARYYTFRAGPVRFVALDTAGTRFGVDGRLSSIEKAWLETELAKPSAARWTVVYGHHPIYSDGEHGDQKKLIRKLLPLLKQYRADVYLAGHEHDLEHFTFEGIEQFITGGGGKDVRAVTKKRADFAASKHGFLEIEASASKMDLRVRGTQGEIFYEKQLRK